MPQVHGHYRRQPYNKWNARLPLDVLRSPVPIIGSKELPVRGKNRMPSTLDHARTSGFLDPKLGGP